MSHAHNEHIGAIAHLLKEIDVPVYATNFTMQLIKDTLKEHGLNPDDYKLKTVPIYAMIKFGNVKVSFLRLHIQFLKVLVLLYKHYRNDSLYK